MKGWIYGGFWTDGDNTRRQRQGRGSWTILIVVPSANWIGIVTGRESREQMHYGRDEVIQFAVCPSDVAARFASRVLSVIWSLAVLLLPTKLPVIPNTAPIVGSESTLACWYHHHHDRVEAQDLLHGRWLRRWAHHGGDCQAVS